jgi:hypothetical protein
VKSAIVYIPRNRLVPGGTLPGAEMFDGVLTTFNTTRRMLNQQE